MTQEKLREEFVQESKDHASTIANLTDYELNLISNWWLNKMEEREKEIINFQDTANTFFEAYIEPYVQKRLQEHDRELWQAMQSMKVEIVPLPMGENPSIPKTIEHYCTLNTNETLSKAQSLLALDEEK